MFIRFVTPRRDRSARVEAGLFGPAYDLTKRHWERNPPWQITELQREIEWFAIHLDVPNRFVIQDNRPRGMRRGICWFDDRATAHVSHARYMAFLLNELGSPVRTVSSNKPGTVLWRDQHQIVALPDARRHPVAF